MNGLIPDVPEPDSVSWRDLHQEVLRLRGLMRTVAAERGNARCHISLHEMLEQGLPEGDTSFCGVADKAAFLAQCEHFWETDQCPSVKGRHTCPNCGGSGVVAPK